MPRRKPVNEFAHVLVDARKALALSNGEIADATFVGPKTVTRWIYHGKEPSPSQASQLVKFVAPKSQQWAEALARVLGVQYFASKSTGAGNRSVAPTPPTPDAIRSVLFDVMEQSELPARSVRAIAHGLATHWAARGWLAPEVLAALAPPSDA